MSGEKLGSAAMPEITDEMVQRAAHALDWSEFSCGSYEFSRAVEVAQEMLTLALHPEHAASSAIRSLPPELRPAPRDPADAGGNDSKPRILITDRMVEAGCDESCCWNLFEHTHGRVHEDATKAIISAALGKSTELDHDPYPDSWFGQMNPETRTP